MGDLSSVQLVRYLNDVKQGFQAAGSNLHDTVRTKGAPSAGTVKFRKFGRLDMIPRGDYKSVLDALATDHTNVDCIVSPFVLPIVTDEMEQAGSGGEAPMEQDESAIAVGYAMGRQRDYSVIAACEAATPSGTDVTAPSGLTVAKLAEILEPFDKYEMRSRSGAATNDGHIYTLIGEKQHRNLLADALTQSIDTSNFKSLVDGKVEEFSGHKLILIGTGRGSKGLAASGGVRRIYSYVKAAMGQACSVEPRIRRGYEVLMTSDVLVGQLMVGSVNVDADGILQTNCTES